MAIGLAMFLPAMSGAEPPDGSNKPLLFAPNATEPCMPIDQGSIAASSDTISAQMLLPVTITSDAVQECTSCAVALSMYRCDSSTSGYSAPILFIVSRQSCDVSSTLALSTLQTFLLRMRAALKATCATRTTSGSL